MYESGNESERDKQRKKDREKKNQTETYCTTNKRFMDEKGKASLCSVQPR